MKSVYNNILACVAILHRPSINFQFAITYLMLAYGNQYGDSLVNLKHKQRNSNTTIMLLLAVVHTTRLCSA